MKQNGSLLTSASPWGRLRSNSALRSAASLAVTSNVLKRRSNSAAFGGGEQARNAVRHKNRHSGAQLHGWPPVSQLARMQRTFRACPNTATAAAPRLHQ